MVVAAAGAVATAAVGADPKVNVQLEPIRHTDKRALQAMLVDYLHELSELADGDWDAASYPFLDEQWSEPGRHPFFIVHKAVRAGLLLVRDERSTLTEWRQIAEFYIAPDFRGAGVAQAAAHAACECFPGHWELTVHQDNTRAVRFWQRFAATTSIGGVQMDTADGIVRLRFEAGLAGPSRT